MAWKDPRSGKVYRKFPSRTYLPSGLHKSFLVPYNVVTGSDEPVKVMEPKNSIQGVVPAQSIEKVVKNRVRSLKKKLKQRNKKTK